MIYMIKNVRKINHIKWNINSFVQKLNAYDVQFGHWRNIHIGHMVTLTFILSVVETIREWFSSNELLSLFFLKGHVLREKIIQVSMS